MVNTRILEQRVGWRITDPATGGGAEGAPDTLRALGHEPLLQGRISSSSRTGKPGAAGLAGPRGRLERAAVDETWAALPRIADSLEACAASRGEFPALGRGAPSAVALDQLRSQILRVVSARGWRRIGIAAPRRGAGASFLATGLAASLARLDYLHLALVDLDLSRPSLDQRLGLDAPGPLEAVLRGEMPPLSQVRRVGETLALVLNGQPVPAAAELLHSPESILALRGFTDILQPDLMLFDLPPLLSDPSIQAVLSQVDTILLVADGGRTTARDITECERLLDGQVPLLGVVLNKSEDRPVPAQRG